jgi:hypothetical protein
MEVLAVMLVLMALGVLLLVRHGQWQNEDHERTVLYLDYRRRNLDIREAAQRRNTEAKS